MNRANRAAQFAPFDSLKGLTEALREKEELMSREEKHTLSEDRQEEISDTLIQLERGMRVEVVFFYNGHYVTLTEKLVDINPQYKYLIVGKAKIYFTDLYEITIKERCFQ